MNDTPAEHWYAFVGHHVPTHYAYATEAQADIYLDALSRNGAHYGYRDATQNESAILDVRGRHFIHCVTGELRAETTRRPQP